MKLEKVAVLGAGAVGAYVLWGLSEKPGIRLGVVAEGERAQRLQNGIGINGKAYHPEVWTPEEAHGADLLIVALKYGALPGALDSIRQVVGEHTIVMSLGLFCPGGLLIFAGVIKQAVAALFEGTGVRFRATEHIREEMWSKFRLNVCNNLPQAILGAGVGCYRDSVHMKAISDGLRKELMAIAAAKGIDLSIVDKNSGRGSAVPPDARYSTLQDIDAGRHTEIDMFSGALMRMGKELGIPTPYNEYTYHMIKALEEKNDGLFDYSGKDQEPTWAK
ncbi:MAG: 2-dehydropantoate 2-reductase [Faecalibacterium sp. CAG:82-related_59_9]|nr:MAG: 2-dehydropantoate 2-reductase [Faecalibacterium sp. CAG:82-related_59_9]